MSDHEQKKGAKAVQQVSEEALGKVIGGAAGRFSDATFTTTVNKSSPKLFQF